MGSDPSTQPAARKGALRKPGGKPAPKVDVTPPTKRVLIKSPDPSQTPSTTASEESLHAKKKREAEEALLTRKDLREACKKARLEADFDAAGIGSFLQNFADDPADPKCGQVLASKMASKLAEPPQKMESEEEDEEESEDASDGQEEDEVDTDEEEEEECDGGEGEVDDADEEEEEEEEEEGDDSDEKEKETEDAEEDAELGSEEDECEGEEESAGEDDPCVEGQSVEESNGDKLAAAAARTDAVAKKVRNSTTHKREWDKFSKSAKTKAFPIELAPHFKKNKNSLFGMWLDCGEEWDKVNIAVKQ